MKPTPPERHEGRRRVDAHTRILYVQYATPAAYPPVEHGAILLAEQGCDVRLVGIDLFGGALSFPAHPGIRVSLFEPGPAGWRRKLHYGRFLAWVCRVALAFRPHWIYASDPLSAPATLLLQRLVGARVVYHEHDSPFDEDGRRPALPAVVSWCRHRLAARAAVCILPNAERSRRFATETGRADVLTVWNTPLAREVGPPRAAGSGTGLRVVYRGSIVPARVPETVLQALSRTPATITLSVAGYDPSGGAHVADLRRLADELGLAGRVDFVGAIGTRDALMAHCRQFDAGLALLPRQSSSPNEQAMLGASNKPFDYMASGLALVVADLPDWRKTYVEPGYGLACDPASVDSIASALVWLASHPADRVAMGERGRQQVLRRWNYERAFAPVLARITGLAAGADAASARMEASGAR